MLFEKWYQYTYSTQGCKSSICKKKKNAVSVKHNKAKYNKRGMPV